MSKCRSCGADIEWKRTKNGKTMPVVYVGPGNGNVSVIADGSVSVGGPGSGNWQSHFADCANADEHRGQRSLYAPAGFIVSMWTADGMWNWSLKRGKFVMRSGKEDQLAKVYTQVTIAMESVLRESRGAAAAGQRA